MFSYSQDFLKIKSFFFLNLNDKFVFIILSKSFISFIHSKFHRILNNRVLRKIFFLWIFIKYEYSYKNIWFWFNINMKIFKILIGILSKKMDLFFCFEVQIWRPKKYVYVDVVVKRISFFYWSDKLKKFKEYVIIYTAEGQSTFW